MVAGDLVHGARVQVMDGSSAVTVECVRAHRGQSGRDLCELVLHGLVQRGAPEREPGTAAVLELRMYEPLGHRSSCDPNHGKCRLRAAPELDAGGQAVLVGELDQLAERDAPRRRAVPEVREIGHGRHADVEMAGRESAVNAADERIGGGVVLPEELERRLRRSGLGRCGLGCGHEPFRIGAKADAVPDPLRRA